MSDDRWAVVLGVSSGTGAAAARALARDAGFNIFGLHRGHHQASADALEAELKTIGVRSIFRKADAGTAEAAERETAALKEQIGERCVGLFLHSIANASIGHFLSSTSERVFKPKHVEKTFSAMAHSFPYWVQSLHRAGMLADGARMLALTNPGPEINPPGGALIVAAKAALEQYVRFLAMELGPLGFRVNALKFGTVITPALLKIVGEEQAKVVERLHEELNPARRICTVDDVAKQIVHLTTEEAEWFNGAVIDFSGGMLLEAFQLLVRKNAALMSQQHARVDAREQDGDPAAGQ